MSDISDTHYIIYARYKRRRSRINWWTVFPEKYHEAGIVIDAGLEGVTISFPKHNVFSWKDVINQLPSKPIKSITVKEITTKTIYEKR